MTHPHDEPGCRPCLAAFDAVGGTTVRSTGQMTSEPVVTPDTRRIERIGAYKGPETSWRALVKHRIDSYLPHGEVLPPPEPRTGAPNFYAVY